MDAARVLLVEDVADLRTILSLALRSAGYAVAEAGTGAGGLADAVSNSPDVIILDLALPDLHGLTVLDALKADQRTSPSPVLVVTADDSPSTIRDALGRGAHDHIRKPFNVAELLARVEAAVRVKREHDRLVAAREAMLAQRSFIETVMATVAAVVIVLDMDGRIVHFNRAAEELSGWGQAEMVGQVVWDTLMLPGEAARARDLYENTDLNVHGHPLRHTVNHWRTKDGEVRLLSWTNGVLVDDDGTTRYAVATGIDITDLRAADERLRACLDVLHDGIVILDAERGDNGHGPITEFVISYMNPAARNLVRAYAVGDRLLASQPPALYTPALMAAFVSLVDDAHGFHHRHDVDGQTLDLTASKLGDGVVVAVRDVTQRRLAEEQLAFAATHDDLTGLANRPMLNDRLWHALARRFGNADRSVAVLFIDLDGFKLINDELGHHAGDEILVAVSAALEGAVRPADTVARFGGDEFVVVAEDLPDGGDPTLLVGRLREAVGNVWAGKHQLRASVGVAVAWDGATPDELIKRADEAMYRAKRSGPTATS